MIIRDHFGYTVVSWQGTGNITSIRSHAPSLVVSVSKIPSRWTGVGTTMAWVYMTSIRSHAPSLVHNLSYTSKLWIRASSTETGYLRRGQFPNVKGDPLLPFLFKLRFSSALRDGIGVFKPISLRGFPFHCWVFPNLNLNGCMLLWPFLSFFMVTIMDNQVKFPLGMELILLVMEWMKWNDWNEMKWNKWSKFWVLDPDENFYMLKIEIKSEKVKNHSNRLSLLERVIIWDHFGETIEVCVE